MKKPLLFLLLSLTTQLLASAPSKGAEIYVAVASNFKNAAIQLATVFESNTNHDVILIFGSTGKHYAQIINGAPFEVFLAADIKRPELLEKEGIAAPGSRFTYAVGRLVLWSPKNGYVDANGNILESGQFRFLAIANPDLAPYGRAARQVLQGRGLWGELTSRMVRGENIAQTFQFVMSRNSEVGFVAYSQVRRPNHAVEGSFWEVPQTLYTPIEQQAVLLKDSVAARSFLSFLQSDLAIQIIHDFGYDTP